MKKVTILVLLIASTCFAYDVVLKNGKVLTGEVISDNPDLLTLKDSSGVQLQIRKNQIDSIKTEERNKKSETITTPPEKQEVPETLPDKPKAKARVYKKEDLEKMPELSIVGNKDDVNDEALKNQQENRSIRLQDAEAEWNEEALKIDDRIQQARESYEDNKSVCDKVIPDMNDLYDGAYVRLTAEQFEKQRRFACMAADDAASDVKKGEVQLERLQEDARKKGIPPGWVDPDRIRN